MYLPCPVDGWQRPGPRSSFPRHDVGAEMEICPFLRFPKLPLIRHIGSVNAPFHDFGLWHSIPPASLSRLQNVCFFETSKHRGCIKRYDCVRIPGFRLKANHNRSSPYFSPQFAAAGGRDQRTRVGGSVHCPRPGDRAPHRLNVSFDSCLQVSQSVTNHGLSTGLRGRFFLFRTLDTIDPRLSDTSMPVRRSPGTRSKTIPLRRVCSLPFS